MASPIGPKGSIAIDTDDKGSSIDIQISESAGVKAENLSLSTWGASFILANHLHNLNVPSLSSPSKARGKIGEQSTRSFDILELGAGTGLVGLAAASMRRANVILTDLPSIVSGLVANVRLNEGLLNRRGASVSVGSLDWAKPDAIYPARSRDSLIQPEASSKPSVILAADTIYDEDHPELLSRTILTWLAPGPSSRVVLCYPLRMAYIDHIREFWDLMAAGGLECTQEAREQGDEAWNEVANTPYEWCIWRWRH